MEPNQNQNPMQNYDPNMGMDPNMSGDPNAQAGAQQMPLGQSVQEMSAAAQVDAALNEPAQAMQQPMQGADAMHEDQAMQAAAQGMPAGQPNETVPTDAPVKSMSLGKSSGKKSHGMVFGMILLGVVAICGVVFGVMMMLQKDNDAKSYENQIASLKKSVQQMQDEMAQDETEAGSGAASGVVSSDYFYLSEFGIKVKKPENWQTSVNAFDFYNGYPQSIAQYSIMERVSGEAEFPAINYVENCPNDTMVCLSIDGKNLGMTVGQDVTEEFKNYFSNPEVYSQI